MLLPEKEPELLFYSPWRTWHTDLQGFILRSSLSSSPPSVVSTFVVHGLVLKDGSVFGNFYHGDLYWWLLPLR